MDPDVYDYVMDNEDAESFYNKFYALLAEIMPKYKAEGKTSVTIAIGCTGGQHRSVAFAERIGKDFSDAYAVDITHRDIKKHKETVNRS